MDDLIKKPLWVLALGAAIGLALWGLLAGIAQVLPALGVMVSLAISGTAAGFTIAPELGTVASYGTAATGAALSIYLAVRFTYEAKKRPLVWSAPILGVISGFITNLCKQFWIGPKIAWLIFSVVIALLVIVGGVLYGCKGWWAKVAGVICTIVAPLAILASAARYKPEALRSFFAGESLALWMPLLLLVASAVLLAVLAHIAANIEA